MMLSRSVSLTNTQRQPASASRKKKKKKERLPGPAISNTASKIQVIKALSPSTSPVCTSYRRSVIQRDSRCFDFKCTENANQLSKSHFWIISPQIKMLSGLPCRTHCSNVKQALLKHFPGHLCPSSLRNPESPCLFIFYLVTAAPYSSPSALHP